MMFRSERDVGWKETVFCFIFLVYYYFGANEVDSWYHTQYHTQENFWLRLMC